VFFSGGHSVANGLDLFNVVDIYDASANTWSTAQLSESRMDIAVAVAGSKIFFAGGSDKVDIYDNSNNSWSTARLSEARSCLSAVTAGNKIYFAGGYSGDFFSGCYTSNRVDIYDTITGSWSVSKMNQPMCYRAAIATGNKIIWAGGRKACGINNPKQLTQEVEIRDVTTQVSTYACLFQINAEFKAVVKDNKIVFFTGKGTSSTDHFDIYNTTTNVWSIGVMNLNFEDAAIFSVNNTIYVAGGLLDRYMSRLVFKLEF
jgi:N-acetylneuraminic acid mutarotase